VHAIKVASPLVSYEMTDDCCAISWSTQIPCSSGVTWSIPSPKLRILRRATHSYQLEH